MNILNSILLGGLRGRINGIQHAMSHAQEVQHKLFKQLISKAAGTEWGKKYGYASIKSYEDFKNQVPISTYEQFFPWIERNIKGEQNLLWPSNINWFAKSSGTTNGRSKFIPVSREALHQTHFKGGKDLISLYVHNNPDSRMFAGKGLAIGGSYYNNPERKNSYFGDVSAVIMANLPIWAQFVRTPSLKIATMSEWESKLDSIAKATLKENVTNISGVPTWTIILMEKILEMTGKNNVFEVWPNVEAFFHGAVAFHPYREVFRKLFPSNSMHYIETYNASEGFFGLQDRLRSDDMLLMTDYGIFYEFIPFDQIEEENPQVCSLHEVEVGKIYAIVISTNAGLWRYKIGDTIKFTSISPYRIKIAGRTKHFINAFGEELIIENAETAITESCQKSGATISNFTAAPIYFGDGKKGGHEWVIEFLVPPSDPKLFTIHLDNALKQVNSDYEAKRYKDLALQMPIVHIAKTGTFYKWMKQNGKLGGQHKVPRLSNSREYIEDLLPFLKNNDKSIKSLTDN